LTDHPNRTGAEGRLFVEIRDCSRILARRRRVTVALLFLGAVTASLSSGVAHAAQAGATPAAPLAPNMTRLTPDLAVGLPAALVLALMLVLLLDGRDTSLGTPATLAVELDLIGGPPLLGAIPQDRRVSRREVAVAEPDGARAAGYRMLRTNLQSVLADRVPKVLAVTSALPGEGRTGTALNLAAALSENGARVCLVDADLRRPCVADTLGLPRHTGLTTVLIGRAGLEDVLQRQDAFAVLTSGPRPADPGALLGTEVMRRTMLELAERFDHVVVDTGPLLGAPDAAVLAPAVDGYLLVVHAGRTTRSELSRSVRALQRTGAVLTGTVLNRSRRRGDARSYHSWRQARAATIPSRRRRPTAARPLTPPCGPTTHTTAPLTTKESAKS
jgi:non-specific protein-tyrosine kinase